MTIPADSPESLDKWLATLAADAPRSPQHAELHAAAVRFAAAVGAMGTSEYRTYALCKFADALTLAYVAGRGHPLQTKETQEP